ncbi:MAG: RNA polymerase sigma factor [Methylocystaceae bacterium]
MITIAASWFNNLRDRIDSFGYMFNSPDDMAIRQYNQQSFKLVALVTDWYRGGNNYPLLPNGGTAGTIRPSTNSVFIRNMVEQCLSKAAFSKSLLKMHTDNTELSWDELCLKQTEISPGGEINDNELIVRINGGNHELFAEIVKRYQKRVAALIYSLIQVPDDVDDMAQDVFITVYRHLEQFEFRSSFSTWIYRIAINKCRDWQRKQYRYKYWFKGWDDNLEYTAVTQESTEDRVTVRQQINQLDEKYRIVIVLYYFQGMKCQEIASILKVSNKTVETRLFRARKLLADRLREV